VDERLEPQIERRQERISEAIAGVDLVLSPTQFLADSLRADGLVFPELHVEPTGVPAASGRVKRTSGKGVRILFVGTWVTHKGPQVLARALAAMPDALFENGAVEALAIGPAPFPAFQQEVVEIARERLQLREALPPREVPSALADADLLVVPSLWAENAPLIVLESLAAGTPVISSQLGGLPELLKEDGGGLLFEAGNHRALASILTELVDNPERLRNLTDNVRVPRTLSDFAAAIEQHYEEICASQNVRATGS
jgi:glycosyltransferase involved in cell wall biosynthesis